MSCDAGDILIAQNEMLVDVKVIIGSAPREAIEAERRAERRNRGEQEQGGASVDLRL